MNRSTPILPETTLLLIRHAHSTMVGRFCGHSDAPLSDVGGKQLREIVGYLERWPISCIYSSDLRRAHDTAIAIAASKSLPLLVRAGLREINFGQWEGLSWEEIEAMSPAAAASWLAEYPQQPTPGGESFEDYRAKVEGEVAALVKESGQGCAAVVTHAGFIRAALVSVLGIPAKSMDKIELDYGGITALHYSGQGWQIRGINLR